MGIFDFLKPKRTNSQKNLEESRKKQETSFNKVHYNDVQEKDGVTYFKDAPFTGIVEFGSGHTIAEFKDGVKVNSKQLFADGSIKAISEVVDGELIETQGWIKIDGNGNYDENGEKVLSREFKDGKKITYYNNGNIKSEDDVNRRRSATEENSTFSQINYFENGNIQSREVKTKYDETGNNGGITVEYELYYESGEIQKKKIDDKKFPTKYVSYYRDGTIKSICVSTTQFQHQGHEFNFDENGNETTIRFEEELKGEESIREHLQLGEFRGQLKTKPKERKILEHEIMTKGVFYFESDNGDSIEIFGQRHTLICITEFWDNEVEEWIEEDREEVDEFHLTDYEKGYRFDYDDLCDLLEIEDYPEWDFNGVSSDWCGIEEEDDYETRENKWNVYKNKFPELSAKSQFKVI